MLGVTSPVISREERLPQPELIHRLQLILAISVFLYTTIVAPASCLGQSEDVVVATLEGKAITQQEVDDSIAVKLIPLQQQLYALRRVALENLITGRLIQNEATRQKLSVEELRRNLMVGPVTISRDQVELAYSQNASFFAAMSPDEAKERLRLDLETQQRMKYYRASLDKLRKASRLVVNLSAPPLPHDVKDGAAPTIGPKTAAVTIVEFSDFECPFCKTVQPTLKQIIQEYGDNIRLEFRNLPLEGHRNALPAALSAYCASEQDRFWQYHDALFSASRITTDSLNELALGLGLNLKKFQVCVSSQDSINAITRDLDFARRFKIESTPSFIINGQLIGGAISVDEFRRIIEKELRFQGSAKPSSSN